MASRMPWRRAPQPVAAPGMTPQRAALEEERRRLAERVAESTWDLGGLVYEMAVRDHFRVDVLTQRAAGLQRLDAQLSEVERLVADHEGIAGHCRFCGAAHGRSAEFCWSCGERLLVRQVLTTIDGTAAAPGPPAPVSAGPAPGGHQAGRGSGPTSASVGTGSADRTAAVAPVAGPDQPTREQPPVDARP